MSSWLLATLFLSQIVLAEAESVPVTFQDPTKIYSFMQSRVFDIDSMLEKIGITAYACRLQNGEKNIDHRGIGACIYESANYTFKEKMPSTILLWILNDQGQYLPPVKMVWKTSQTGWFSAGQEFLYLSFESIMSIFVKNSLNLKSEKAGEDCSVERDTRTDLGNILGDLEISIPKGRKISDYFKITKLDFLDTQKISLSTKMPFYLNKKRSYKVTGILLNDKSEMIHVSLFTNFNLVKSRDFCLASALKTEFNPLGLVRP